VTARLLCPDLLVDADRVLERHAVLVESERVVRVGPRAELARQRPDAVVDDLAGCALFPGTVNAHSHSFQSLLRGLSDEAGFEGWLATLYRLTPRIEAEHAYAAARAAFAEMLLRGVTSVVDFFYLNHGTNERALAVARAAEETGIRLVLARSMYDGAAGPEAFREDVPTAERNVRALAAALQGSTRVSVIPAPHSPHAASSAMVRAGAVLAREMGTPWHIHVAERQVELVRLRASGHAGSVSWLAALGALDERTRIVHGVWVSENEIASLARAGAALVHCPGSNMFLGDGRCPLERYLGAGVTVALGCDSSSANGRLSVLDQVRLASLLLRERGRTLPLATALAMATRSGASATGLPVGALDPGCYADAIALDLSDPSLRPLPALRAHLVHSIEVTAVRHVYVAGERVVADRRLVRVSEDDIRRELDAAAAGIANAGDIYYGPS
jgi:5-methylthioadenosine/S-adenosylhomocysteine deaminase